MSKATTSETAELQPLSGTLITLMAIAIGVIVANLYYLQPLLHQVTKDFHISESKATLLLVLIQTGYAAGLAFVVPLGDLVPRRRLAVLVFALSSLMVFASAAAHSFVLFAAITFFIGLASCGGQVILPLGADMADPALRGRVIGRLMTGLLMGLMLSRSFSGVVAQAAGWRTVYVAAGVALALMAVMLWRVLPNEPVRERVAYGRLLAGTLGMFATFPMLRRRALYGFLIFAAFSTLWTTLAFHLSATPFHYDNLVIGLFGIVGAAGVLAANVAGRFADKERAHLTTIACGLLIVLSFIVLYVGRNVIVILAIGIVMLDAGMQGLQITNQSIIYSLAPEARSRINSAYMVCAFIGAACGSLAAGQCYAHAGWRGDCMLGAGIGVVTLALALLWRDPISTT